MSESRLRSTPNHLNRGLLAVGMALAPIAIAACSNPTQSSNRTASQEIRPCSDNPDSPDSSDGHQLSESQSRLVASANQQAKVVYERVEANRGNITLNQNLGTLAVVKNNKLILKTNESTYGFVPAYEVDIAFESGNPVIGRGTLACNAPNGHFYETSFDRTLDYFYSQTGSFATAANN